MKCYSNVLVAVRRVTQTNKGKNTAGMDKLVVKTPKARGALTDGITIILCESDPENHTRPGGCTSLKPMVNNVLRYPKHN
jgi:hypothetical protein